MPVLEFGLLLVLYVISTLIEIGKEEKR